MLKKSWRNVKRPVILKLSNRVCRLVCSMSLNEPNIKWCFHVLKPLMTFPIYHLKDPQLSGAVDSHVGSRVAMLKRSSPRDERPAWDVKRCWAQVG